MSSLLLALLLGSAVAEAAPTCAPLARVMTLHDQLAFEACAQLAKQLDPAECAAVEDRAQVALFGGLCLFNGGDAEGAQNAFAGALALHRELALPEKTSPRILEVFAELRQSLPRPSETAAAAAEPSNEAILLRPAAAPGATVERSGAPGPWTIGLGAGAAAGLGVFTYAGLRSRSEEVSARSADFASERATHFGAAQHNAAIANVALALGTSAAVGAVIAWIAER